MQTQQSKTIINKTPVDLCKIYFNPEKYLLPCPRKQLIWATSPYMRLQKSKGNKWVFSITSSWSIGVSNIVLYWCLHTVRGECRERQALNRPWLKISLFSLWVFVTLYCFLILERWQSYTISHQVSPFPGLSHCTSNTNTNVNSSLLLEPCKLALCKCSILSK